MAADLACDKFWVNKNTYHDAERKYQENLSKLQRRLDILGRKNEETNNKKNNIKTLKKCKNIYNVNNDELRKELLNLEAHENAKNKMFHSGTQCFELIKGKEESNYFNDLETKKQFKEDQKEMGKKKNKTDKKNNKSKENENGLLGGVGMAKINRDAFPKTSLAGEVAKARQHIKTSLECMENINGVGNLGNPRLAAILENMEKLIENLTKRVEALEKECSSCKQHAASVIAVCPAKPQASPVATKPSSKDDEDDVDLFGSESEEEDEEAKKIREQRLAEYAAKKSKKPALVAKSNIILDIKPWDDETDMKEMEKAVKGIEMDGLIWGASKLVPVAFKIFKLQISCVIEDDKVSVDLLTEKLEKIEDYIQSVDIAAFNKV